MRQWRLINDPHTTGARNMAVDEAILYAVGAGQHPPTLRVYGWAPPALSIGYGQRAREVDSEALREYGWDMVRRPTGGRAILHIDELTYSIALPADHPLARGGVVESYQAISRALLNMLDRLGGAARADRMADDVPKSQTPVCFDTPSHYEITVNGKKLIGSAQVRRAGGVLQHGSIPLTGDIARICDGLVYSDDAARESARWQVRERALTLADALGRELTWQESAAALIDAAADTFEVMLVSNDLSQTEISAADRLEQEIYTSDSWTLRR